MRGDVLCAHAGRSFSLLLLLFSIHLFFFSFSIYSRSSSPHVSSTTAGNRRIFLSYILFICQEKKRREEKKNERKKMQNVDEQHSSFSPLVKCTIEFLLLTDTRHTIKFHQYYGQTSTEGHSRCLEIQIY